MNSIYKDQNPQRQPPQIPSTLNRLHSWTMGTGMGQGEFTTLSSGLRGMTGKYIVKMYVMKESNLVPISEHLYQKIMMCEKKKNTEPSEESEKVLS